MSDAHRTYAGRQTTYDFYSHSAFLSWELHGIAYTSQPFERMTRLLHIVS